ncbi:MAG: DUF1298 domain-containing protein [Acidimicrobiales bacterium]|nr:DUF1298 domain-containing protein [Acidimicrobiales bacterium]
MRDRPYEFERRMTEAEALMWHLEKDPFLSSSFASVTFLDAAPDLERFKRRMARAVAVVPRLRQRVAPAFGRFIPPAWEDDPDFDLDFHVRRVSLPPPAGPREVLDHAALVLADPIDRTRPLWEFVVVEGLVGGQAALVQKMHHTVTDGEGGIRISAEFLDLDREAPDPPPLEAGPDLAPAPARLGGLAEVVAGTVKLPLAMARGALGALRRPGDLPAAGIDAVANAQSLLRQLAVTERAHSPLWTDRSLRRRVEVLQVPFDDARAAAKAMGGTLNDLFVAAAARAAGAYHQRLDAPVRDLRASVALSTRTTRSVGGNAFSLGRLLVPTDLPEPRATFDVIRDRMGSVRASRQLGAVDTLAAVVNLLPTPVLVGLARQQVSTVDFATSNVRAAPFDLYIAGARILANYAIGPTGGTAFNVTLMSYAGQLDLGVNIDTAAVAEPELLRDLLEGAFAELIAAAG